MAAKRRRRVAPRTGLSFDARAILGRAIEEGVALGWNRAHKHAEHPGPEVIREAIEQAVMGAIDEVVRWDY